MAEKLDLDAMEKRLRERRPVAFTEIRAMIARIRELEDDRESWAEQASQRVSDWEREHDLRVAAERRVGELERASQTGSGEAEPIGYMNERAVSILAQGSVMCTHVSPMKTEFQQVAIYKERT